MFSQKPHSLLNRQIKKYFGDAFAIHEPWRGFIDAVNNAYHEADIDRKMLERSLDLSSLEYLQANSEMRTIFEAVPDIFFKIDHTGTILDCKTGNIFDIHISQRNIIGEKIYDLLSNAAAAQFRKAIDGIRQTGKPVSFEYILAHEKDYFYEVRLIPLLEDQTIVIIRNVTDRKGAQSALKKSEEIFTRLVNAMPDIVVRLDPNSKILFVNDYALQISGYRRHELEGQNMLIFIAPEDRRRAIQSTLLMMGTKQAPREYDLVMKDGRRVPCEINGDLLRNEDGSLFGFVVVCRDISQRKQTEEALRQSEEIFSTIFRLSPACISLSTFADGRYIAANDLWYRTSEYSPEEVIGQTSTELGIWANPDDLKKIMHTMLLNGVIHDQEYLFRSKSGKMVSLLYSAEVIEISGVRHIVSVALNVTESRKAMEEKRNLEVRLQRAERMEALGQLAGGVAHDLNNVLGALTGYSELLLMEIPEHQRSREKVMKILQSTQKGAAIIQDLLTLARRGVTSSQVINLNGLVSGFFKTPVFEKIKDQHPFVNFSTEYDPNLLNIKGSSLHLEKTLMNLISNAAESISGQGNVTVSTENRYLDKALLGYDEVREGDYAVLTVSDTGMGIAPENKDRIFEPFYTQKTMGRSGTGLGLAIVWGTIRDHKGYIDVQSKIGKGSVFSLYFPVTREKMSVPEREVPIDQYRGKGELILVVDDVAEQRDVASGLLSQLKYNVHTVSSGEAAVDYLRANRADLLVLDMIMAPGIDGLETYKKILKIHPNQKAILVSGFSETQQVREAQRLGAGTYVKKPYILEKIGIAIRNELSR